MVIQASSIGNAFAWVVGCAIFSFSWAPPTMGEDPFVEARRQLVDNRIRTAGVSDPRVLDAIAQTPRHEFVPRSLWQRAYLDMALPIGDAQTISSPFIVALMTETLNPQPSDRVLEVGTGSGYQAAVLSPLVDHVYTIEIVEALGRQAEKDLDRLGYENVSVRVGDGFLGWPEAAPFDKIIVTCSPESIPQPLVDQLREGGRMVIPVGERYQQTLYLLEKKEGELVRQPLRPTLFVPMTGEAEASREQQPDPAKPQVMNGDFERAGENDEFIPGWYYGRQVRRVAEGIEQGLGESRPAVSGAAFARFENETPGLDSHLLQGLAIDGRDVSLVRLGGRVRVEEVEGHAGADSLPMIAVSFYDDHRRDLGTFWVGPFRGTQGWREESRLIRIPPQAREAIVRIGLFGATGRADFDDVRLEPIR